MIGCDASVFDHEHAVCSRKAIGLCETTRHVTAAAATAAPTALTRSTRPSAELRSSNTESSPARTCGPQLSAEPVRRRASHRAADERVEAPVEDQHVVLHDRGVSAVHRRVVVLASRGGRSRRGRSLNRRGLRRERRPRGTRERQGLRRRGRSSGSHRLRGRRPSRAWRRVVLPAPTRPVTTVNVPRSSENEAPSIPRPLAGADM